MDVLDSIAALAGGFAGVFTPERLLAAFVGCLIGTAVGVLPGLGPTTTMALLLSFTLRLEPASGMIMLAGIYFGAMYGGSTTAILLHLPGEPSAAIIADDGYAMARAGRGGPALAIAAISSFVAGTIGLFGLVLLAVPLASLALAFGPAETFALTIFAFTMVVSLAGTSIAKGLAAAAAGIIITMVGVDPQQGIPRFTFGSIQLLGGFDLVALVVGVFGIAEVIASVELSVSRIFAGNVGRLWPSADEFRRSVRPIGRASLIGFLIGMIPGGGPAIASFISYDVEKRRSRTPERFGKGAIEGIAGPSAADNAATSSSFIPLFSLGLPTSPVLAILLGAMTLYGLQPGPLLFRDSDSLIWTVIASMYVGSLMLLVLNLPLVGVWVQLLRIPYALLAPAILGIAFVGAFSLRNSFFDIGTAVAFGVIGYLMRRLGYPVLPLVLGLILGGLAENSFRQALALSGSLTVFIESPISWIWYLLAIGGVIFSIRARRGRRVLKALAED